MAREEQRMNGGQVYWFIKQFGLGGLGLVFVGLAFKETDTSRQKGYLVVAAVCFIGWALVLNSLGVFP